MCSQHRQSLIGTRVSLLSQLLGTAMAGVLAMTALGAEQPTSSPSQPTLHLANGGNLAGTLRASSGPGVLRWQASSPDSSRDFALKEVNFIEWPQPAARPEPVGDFRFELTTGDVLYGSLLALDDARAELDVPRLGRIHIQRSNLHRIDRWRGGADLIYVGPNGLAGWKERGGQKNWRDDSGRPMTDRELASIQGDFGLPVRSSIEFEVSWKRKADFVFALGVGDTEQSIKRAFRFEAWGGDLICQREAEQQADLNVVQEIARGPGRSHFQLYLDQEKERILIYSPGGKRLADMTVRGIKPVALPGLCLTNVRGDLRLDRLRIGRWDGQIPGELSADQTRIHRGDGSIIDGQLTGFDAALKEYHFKTERGELRVAENQISSVLLPVGKDETPRTIRAVFHDGTRVSGDLVKVEDGMLVLTVPGIQEPLRLTLEALRALVVVRNEHPGGTGP